MEEYQIKTKVVGVDISNERTTYAIVDIRGNIIAEENFPTGDYPDVNNFVKNLSDKIVNLVEANGGYETIRSIGVSSPSASSVSGCIENAANLPWKGVLPLGEMLNKALDLPVAVTNDANAAAIGEMTYGAARGMRDFIMITLGTGVGSGIVVNGQLVYGSDGFAGELGHTCAIRDGRQCGCGKKGCLETYCSATGMARTAVELLSTRQDASLLRDLDPAAITSKDVYDAAIKGDALAKEIFDYTGRIMGQAFADFVSFSAPEAIVLFGGLAQSGDLLLKPIREAMEANLLPYWKGKVKLIPSALKSSESAILGAAALGWKAQ